MADAPIELSERLCRPADIATRLDALDSGYRAAAELHAGRFAARLAGAFAEAAAVGATVEQVGADVARVQDACAASAEHLTRFSTLIHDTCATRQLSQTYQRFALARRFLHDLRTAEDDCRTDDLREYHARVYDREEFLAELELYNYGLAPDDFAHVEEACTAIRRQSLALTAVLMEIADDALANPAELDALNDIVAREEARDALIRRATAGRQSDDPVARQYARAYPRYVGRDPKDLREKLAGVIRSAIAAKFADPPAGTVFADRVAFVLPDLARIRAAPPLTFFGPHEFLAEYHRGLKALVDRSLPNLDAGEILGLIEFKTAYYNAVEAQFHRVPEALGERLVGSEAELLERYAAAATCKLREWIGNIAVAEIGRLRARDREVARDEDGKLVSTGFISLLEIIKMQLEPIAFNRRAFARIADAVRAACDGFRTRLAEELEHEMTRACQGRGEPGFEDYCIVFGNSGLKLAQYVAALPLAQSAEVRDLGGIFMGVLRASNAVLAEFVESTCRPALAAVFTAAWYEAGPLETLAATVADFLQDYREAMSAFSFAAFVSELGGCLTAAYLRQLRSRRAVVTNAAGETLRRDYEGLRDLFGEFVAEDEAAEIFALLPRLVPLLETTNADLFAVELRAARLLSGAMDAAVARNIIARRSDMDGDTRRQLQAVVGAVYDETPTKRGLLGRIL